MEPTVFRKACHQCAMLTFVTEVLHFSTTICSVYTDIVVIYADIVAILTQEWQINTLVYALLIFTLFTNPCMTHVAKNNIQ